MIIRFKETEKNTFIKPNLLLEVVVRDNYGEYIKLIKSCGNIYLDGFHREIYDTCFNPYEDIVDVLLSKVE